MIGHQHFGAGYGSELCVGAVTAINALGFSAYETWAYRRAELTGYGESPFRLSSGERATMAFVPTLSPTSMGLSRMLAMLNHTLTPLLTPALASTASKLRVGIAISLPSRMNGEHEDRRFAAERRQLESFVYERATEHGLSPQIRMYPNGHAGFALAALWAGIQLASDQLDVVLVGGVDTYYDPDVMQALMLDQRVFCTDSIDAIIPGEAASFVLLTRRNLVRGLGLRARARIDTISVGEEKATLQKRLPCTGTGLSRTLLVISDRLKQERRSLDWILGDLTNEDYRLHEFQLAYPRFVNEILTREIPLEFLPLAMGDVGAATLPTSLAIATEALSRGGSLPRTENCLLFAGSVGEERGALLASSITEGK